MANDDQITEILQMLARVYPRYELFPDTIIIYCRLLADIDADMLKASALECATKSQWFPSVYELRKASTNLQKRGNRIPAAIEAWYELLNAPADGEYWQATDDYDDEGRVIVNRWKHQFNHPLVEHVARNLGWPKRFWTDNLASDRSKFISAYESELERQTDEVLSLPEVRDYTKSLSGPQPIQELLAKFQETKHG